MEKKERVGCRISYQYVKGESLFIPVRGKKPSIDNQDGEKNHIPLITIEDLVENRSDIIIRKTKDKVPIEQRSSQYILPENSLVFPSKRTIFKKTGVQITFCEAGIDSGLIGLHFIRDINRDYLYYYLNSPVFLEMIDKENLKEIPTRFLLNHYYPIPSPDIQDSIVSLLQSVDSTINDTNCIISRTNDALKGLIQGLFTNGVRKTTFTDTILGRIPDTWQVRTLSSLCQIIKKGGTPTKNRSHFWQGDIPWVAPSDIVGRKLCDDMEFVTKEAIETAGSWIVPAQNILFVAKGDVGAAVITEEDMAIHHDIYGIIPGSELEPLFLYWYFFKNERYFSRFRYESPPVISRKELESILVPLPPRDEQHQIASVMNTLDKKLSHEHRYKNQLVTLREALINSLFPGYYTDESIHSDPSLTKNPSS